MSTVSSKDVRFKISLDGGTTYKKLVCKQAFGIDISKDIQSEQSDCGEHVSVGNATPGTFDFEFLLNTAPASTEVSADDVLEAAQDGTKVFIRADNADSSPSYYRQAGGYIQNYKETAPLNGIVKATGTFKVDGSIDITP